MIASRRPSFKAAKVARAANGVTHAKNVLRQSPLATVRVIQSARSARVGSRRSSPKFLVGFIWPLSPGTIMR